MLPRDDLVVVLECKGKNLHFLEIHQVPEQTAAGDGLEVVVIQFPEMKDKSSSEREKTISVSSVQA